MQELPGGGETEARIERVGALTWMHHQIAHASGARMGDHRFDERSPDALVAEGFEDEHALHVAGDAFHIPRLWNPIEYGQPRHPDGVTVALRDVCDMGLLTWTPPEV